MGAKRDLEFELDPLYMVAIMTVQYELCRTRFKEFDKLLDRSLSELGINHQEFNSYLETNRPRLMEAVEAVGI